MKPGVEMQRAMMAESFVGVPTNTTDTITPTTFKSITQLFESENCLTNLQNLENMDNNTDRGFVVPVVSNVITTSGNIITTSGSTTVSDGKTFLNLDSKAWQGGCTTVVTPTKTSPLSSLPTTIIMEPDNEPELNNTPTTIQTRSKNKRTPKQVTARKSSANSVCSKDGKELSPEEQHKLMVRRERNKQAAARCRKRRVDITNNLQDEVDVWEAKKIALQDEIQQLQMQKEELEFILEAHRTSSTCKIIGAKQPEHNNNVEMIVAVKSEPVIVEAVDAPYTLHEFQGQNLVLEDASSEPKPKRPKSLQLLTNKPVDIPSGIEIETPSTIINNYNFDLVSTGLTPIANMITPMIASVPTSLSINTPVLNTPTCSSQQRATCYGDLRTPDNSKSLVSL